MSEETRSQEQELSEILQIRREKLAALQEEGRDPFKLSRVGRSAGAAELIRRQRQMCIRDRA